MKITISGIIMTLCCSSCHYIASVNDPPRLSFESIKGIKYSEVRREFTDGVSIDRNGFHLEPEWQIYFAGKDSVKIYSEEQKNYMPYRIFHSHKDLYHFARRWFKVKTLSRDSIILQALEVRDRKIHQTASSVYMIFYADNYINRQLRTSVEELRRPNRNDSLYAHYRAIQANSYADSSFAARNPVMFRSKSKILQVDKIQPTVDPNLGEFAKIDEYLNPAYRIVIKKAYRDFTYSFYMRVDHKGNMHFVKFNFPMESEFIPVKTRIAQGIINVYLYNLLDVSPGTTLGYKHSSIVEVFVRGEQNGTWDEVHPSFRAVRK